MADASPLDDFRLLLNRLPRRLPEQGADRLEALARKLAGIQGKRQASFRQPTVAVFAGAHGVARHGVSERSAASVAETLAAMGAGRSALNGICAAYNIGLKAYELALDVPTADIAAAPALDERSAAATVAFGMEALAGGVDLLALAGIGAGGETAAAALGAWLGGGDAAGWARRLGTPEHVRLRREQAIRSALSPETGGDALDAMRRLGGREMLALAGAIAAAALQNVPVILDGEQPAVAALALHRLSGEATGHCVLAHRLASPALAEAAEAVGLMPLLDLGLFDGDGRAGALAEGIALAAARIAPGER